jgi:hypothetical protein
MMGERAGGRAEVEAEVEAERGRGDGGLFVSLGPVRGWGAWVPGGWEPTSKCVRGTG